MLLQVDAPTIQGARWTGAARLPHKLRRWRIAVAPPEQRIHLISINLHIREQDDRAFNDIAQFAHIPTPFMMNEPFHRAGRKVQYGFRRREFPEKIRSEEHTSELQSLMRISYAVSCLKKK